MNAADLSAARRLIAQFEDRAVGRHNSTMFPARQVELPRVQDAQPMPRGFLTHPTQLRSSSSTYGLTVKEDCEKCRVGEYCWGLGVLVPVNVRIFRKIAPQTRAASFSDFPEGDVEMTIDAWDFERVFLMSRDWAGEKVAWKRIS